MSSEDESFSSCSTMSNLSEISSETKSELINSSSSSSLSSSGFSSDSEGEFAYLKHKMEVFENNNEITFVYDNQFIYTWMKPKLPQDNLQKIEKYNAYGIYPLIVTDNKPQMLVENRGDKIEFLFPPRHYEYYTGLPSSELEKINKYFDTLTYEKILNFENRCMV